MTNPLVGKPASTEGSVPWWERNPAVRTLWSTLLFLPDRVRDVLQTHLPDADRQALAALARRGIRELEKLC